MSSITRSAEPNLITRCSKLENFCQCIEKGKGYQQAFNDLQKIDRVNIEKRFNFKDFSDPSKSKEELLKKLLMGVKVYTKELISQSKALAVFQAEQTKAKSSSDPSLVAVKRGIAINPLTIPSDELQLEILSFFAPKDLANFRASFKGAAKIESASYIIQTYHLDSLIETYLHRSCSAINESGKIKALQELMSMAYSLSEIENLPKPSYSSLVAFFQEVEARNLIRLMEQIDRARDLPDLPESIIAHDSDDDLPESIREVEVGDFTIPKDSGETIQKAEVLRGWLEQHKDYVDAFTAELDIDSVGLSLLPKEIGQFKALYWLHLDNNYLVALPKEIGQLKALTVLVLNGNRFTVLPKEIGQLQSLEELGLFGNHLVSLPKEIGQLQSLEVLNLSNGRLATLPKEIGQLKALQGLRLDNNRLISLPKEIGQLRKLDVLGLNNNRLIALPKEIGQLRELYALRLNNNRLKALPKEIGQIRELNELLLHRNRLTCLPKEIGQLKALEKFGFSNNAISMIPAELGRFKGDLKKQNKKLILALLKEKYSFRNRIKSARQRIQNKSSLGNFSL